MDNQFDANKFNFRETFTNSNGKTSGSGFLGIVVGLVGSLTVLTALTGYFLKYPDTMLILGKGIEIIAIGAALLGVRKAAYAYSSSKNKTDNDTVDDSNKG